MPVRGHERHGAHKRDDRGVTQLHATHARTAEGARTSSRQDARERRLAAARLAHHGHERARANRCRNALDHAPLAVGVAHVGELDVTAAV